MSGLVRSDVLDLPDGKVVDITLTNQSRRNALGAAMLEALSEALAHAQAESARVVVIRAEAGAATWSAGYDIEELPRDGTDPLTWSNPLEGFLQVMRSAPFPVIAAVEGGVWGGACELVLTCDLVVALETATFAVTPVRLGVPYNTAGVGRFLAALPLNVAREMFFTGDPITAVQAARWGVVSRLVSDEPGLTLATRQLAQTIASRAPLSVRAIKGEIDALTDARSLTSDEFERLTQLRTAAWRSADYLEGIEAFRDRRPPRFTGA